MIEEFKLSGEEAMMKRLAESNIPLPIMFDVGGNVGEWAALALHFFKNTVVHSFEPIPSTYTKLLDNRLPWQIVNPFGLSDTMRWAMFKYTEDNDKLTTQCLELARTNEQLISGLLVDGFSYCTSRKIPWIDILKIDTEGHEYEVVAGFGNMLDDKNIPIIQFEYGYANILAKNLLIDFYRLLEPKGYKIGKLNVDGSVAFKDYNLLDEDFKGPNYVAVLADRQDIVGVLQS